MHINIKSDAAHRMAKELAQLTGESISGAVTRSIEDRLKRVRRDAEKKRKGLGEIIDNLADEFVALPDLDARPHEDILYDPSGVPK